MCVCVFDFQLQNWEILPKDKVVLSAYTRASGQEWFFSDFNVEYIHNIIKVKQYLHKLPLLVKDKTLSALNKRILLLCDVTWSYFQAVSPSAGKESPLWAVIDNLHKGFSWHRTKPFLIFEVRYFQATTLGLPLEISKYYETVNGITVNGENSSQPLPAASDHLMTHIRNLNIKLFFTAKAAVNPPLTNHLGELLTSEVSLETDGFIG